MRGVKQTHKNFDTRRYEAADHCLKYNHDFDWENNKIMKSTQQQ